MLPTLWADNIQPGVKAKEEIAKTSISQNTLDAGAPRMVVGGLCFLVCYHYLPSYVVCRFPAFMFC